jgi:hypothetical protein
MDKARQDELPWEVNEQKEIGPHKREHHGRQIFYDDQDRKGGILFGHKGNQEKDNV